MNAQFTDLLRKYKVAFVLMDQSWVPRPWEFKDKFDLITADFTYVRWLGDRKGIEAETETWDKVIWDRKTELKNWVSLFREFVTNKKNLKIFAFANNHFEGHSPATVKRFWDLWEK